MNEVSDLIPTRRSLLIRLKDMGDHKSWQEFFETYWKLVYQAAIKAGLSESEAEDVVQDTVIAVCKSIPDFHYQGEKGSFKGWLLRLTSWRIQDAFRERHRRGEQAPPGNAAPGNDESGNEGGLESDSAEEPVPPELESHWNDEWERNLWEAAIGRVKRKVDPSLYQAFDLYVFKAWPVSRVADSLGLTANQIYVAKHRIESLIRAELEILRTKLF